MGLQLDKCFLEKTVGTVTLSPLAITIIGCSRRVGISCEYWSFWEEVCALSRRQNVSLECLSGNPSRRPGTLEASRREQTLIPSGQSHLQARWDACPPIIFLRSLGFAAPISCLNLARHHQLPLLVPPDSSRVAQISRRGWRPSSVPPSLLFFPPFGTTFAQSKRDELSLVRTRTKTWDQGEASIAPVIITSRHPMAG